MALLGSTSLYYTLLWLYLVVYTGLYLILLHSTMALLGSTWFYFSLLDSTALYHAFTWLYLTVLNSVTLYHGFSLDIHDPTTLYHGSLGST